VIRSLRKSLAFPLVRSRLVARLRPFRQPAILLLSYPRSGSSWIGEVLSHSPDLAYLREPVTQPYHARFSRDQPRDTVFLPRPGDAIERYYRRCATAAFAGIPPVELLDGSFPARAFRLSGRESRRLLVKEVNPLAAGWYLGQFALQLLVLIRHPAAVADSVLRAGWWTKPEMEAFGREYGDALESAIAAAGRSPPTVLRYEDFAADPATHFLTLFQLLAVRAPVGFEQLIAAYSHAPGQTSDPYAVRRLSRAEITKWKGSLRPESVDAVRRGYLASASRHYAAPEAW
jgi:hypothetical protein